MALVPFDMPEAETEISDGIFIEYSGTPYAMIKLSKYMLFFILPAFVIAILMNGIKLEGITYSVGSIKAHCCCTVAHTDPEHQSPGKDQAGHSLFLCLDEPSGDHRYCAGNIWLIKN